MATHVAAPHTTRSKPPLVPQEEIGSVLERFQKWAGRDSEPVRELTYEEAVSRSRRRVYTGEDSAPKPVDAASAIPDSANPTTNSKAPTAKTRTAKSAQAGSAKSGRTVAAKPGGVTNKKNGKPLSGKAVAREVENAASTATSHSSHHAAGTAYQAIQQASGEIISSPVPTGTFQQALAAQFNASAAPLTVNADAKPVAPLSGDAPAVHLTVRLAKEERDAVRERAHDLGITPSAYMRHCILEIDSLRVELETARLTYAHASAATTLPNAPALPDSRTLSWRRQNALQLRASNNPWLARFMRMLLPGKTGHL